MMDRLAEYLMESDRRKTEWEMERERRQEEREQQWLWAPVAGTVETNRVFAEPAKGGGSYCHCWFVSRRAPIAACGAEAEAGAVAENESDNEDEWARKADAAFHAHEDVHLHGTAHEDVVDPADAERELGAVWGAMLQKRFAAAKGQYLYAARTTEHEEVNIGPLSVAEWSKVLVDAPRAASQTALPGTKPGASGFYLSKRLILAQYHVNAAGQWVRSERPAPALSQIPELLRDRLVSARGSLPSPSRGRVRG